MKNFDRDNIFRKSQSSIKKFSDKSLNNLEQPSINLEAKSSRLSEQTPNKQQCTNSKYGMSQSLLLNNNTQNTQNRKYLTNISSQNSSTQNIQHQNQGFNKQQNSGLLKSKLASQMRQKTQDKGDIHTTFMENSKKGDEIQQQYKNQSIFERFLQQEKEITEKQKKANEHNNTVQQVRQKRTQEDIQLIQSKKRVRQLENLSKNLSLKIQQKIEQIKQDKQIIEQLKGIKIQQEQLYTQKLLMKSNMERQLNKIIQSLQNEKNIKQIQDFEKEIQTYIQNQEQMETENTKITEQISTLQQTILQKKEQLEKFEQNGEAINNNMEIALQEVEKLRETSEKRRLEYSQRKKEVKILQEQIFWLKKQSRKFLLIIPKNALQGKTQNIFDYENYYKIFKQKQSLQLIKNDKLVSSTLSNSGHFSNFQQQQDMFKFDFLIERGKQTVFEGFQTEIELFLKGFVYRKYNILLNKLSSNSQEFNYVYDFNKQHSENINNNCINNILNIISMKQQQFQQLPFILMMGDKNRGSVLQLIQYIHQLYNGMENELVKINSLYYTVTYLDRQGEKEDYLSYLKLQNIVENDIKKQIYHKNIIISVNLDIQQQQQQYQKTLNIILLSLQNNNISLQDSQTQQQQQQYVQQLVRQFKQCLKKEIIPNKLKVIEQLEPKIKGMEKYMSIVEVPELIKIGDKSQDKFTKIKNILEAYQQLQKKI